MRLIRTLFRFIGDSFQSMVKNPLMTFASLIVSTFCLFIFGVFIILTMNANYMADKMQHECKIEVNIDPAITEKADIAAIEDKINARKDDYTSIIYRTGKERFDNFKASLSKSELEQFEGVPDNVIGSSYTLTLNDISKAKDTISYLESIEGVTSINNMESLMQKIISITKFIRNASVWIVLVFALISVFIISNTIKLTLYSRRKEINIMKYVGATDAYIRGPFVIEGIIVGLIAAVIAYFGTAYGYNALRSLMNSFKLSSSVLTLEPFSDMITIIMVSYAAIGVGLGALGSFISIRRYLKV